MKLRTLFSLSTVAVFGLLYAGCDTAPRDPGPTDRGAADPDAVQECVSELNECFDQIEGFDPEAMAACADQVDLCLEDAEAGGGGPGGDGGDKPGGDGGDKPEGDGGDPEDDDDSNCSLQISGEDRGVDFVVDCFKDLGTEVIECSCEVDGAESSPFSIPAETDTCGYSFAELLDVAQTCAAQAD